MNPGTDRGEGPNRRPPQVTHFGTHGRGRCLRAKFRVRAPPPPPPPFRRSFYLLLLQRLSTLLRRLSPHSSSAAGYRPGPLWTALPSEAPRPDLYQEGFLPGVCGPTPTTSPGVKDSRHFRRISPALGKERKGNGPRGGRRVIARAVGPAGWAVGPGGKDWGARVNDRHPETLRKATRNTGLRGKISRTRDWPCLCGTPTTTPNAPGSSVQAEASFRPPPSAPAPL